MNGTGTETVKGIEKGNASVKGTTLNVQGKESVTETALEVTSETTEKCVTREITKNVTLRTKSPGEEITAAEVVAVVAVEDLIETRTVKEMVEAEVCGAVEAAIQEWIGNVSYVLVTTGNRGA